jgi:hypothetical protein
MTDRGKSLNKRTQNKRTTRARKTTTSRRPKKKSKFFEMKKGANLVIIWALVVLNAVLIFSLVHKIINIQTPNARLDHQQQTEPPENPMTIVIHNGCGVAGLAKMFQEKLVRHHYDIRSVGNAQDPYDNTVIIDRGKRPSEEIEQLRQLVGIKKDRVVKLSQEGYSTDVKIILGKDYSSLKIYKNNM